MRIKMGIGTTATVSDVDNRSQVSEFLRSRRARITPEQVGLIGGGYRRVLGLRREEVALLTGVSVEYYARMERGDLAGVSLDVLDSLARGLNLGQAEYDHLADLSRAAGPPLPRSRRFTTTQQSVKSTLQRFLDAVTGAPMWVRDRRLDYVAANPLGRALYKPMLDDAASQRNMARFTFLNPASRDFFPDWEENADGMVATLRTYAGQTPDDKKLTDLVCDLMNQSESFRRKWARYDVRHHRAGRKRIHHPLVGGLVLSYEVMELPTNPDWFVFAFTPDPGSCSEERLQTLSRMATAQERTDART